MRSWQIFSQRRKPLHFMKPAYSFRSSPQSTTYVYLALDNRITQSHILLQINFSITFPYIPKSLRQPCLFPSSIPTKTLYALLFFLCHKPLPYYAPEFDIRSNVQLAAQIVIIIIISTTVSIKITSKLEWGVNDNLFSN